MNEVGDTCVVYVIIKFIAIPTVWPANVRVASGCCLVIAGAQDKREEKREPNP